MRPATICLALAFVALSCALKAEDKTPAKEAPKKAPARKTVSISDPAQAAKEDPDFLIQGEYSGELKTKDGVQKTGCQVVALGNGAFDAVFYPGGLPGDGWDKTKEKSKSKGQTEPDKTVTFTGQTWNAKLKEGAMVVSAPDGQEAGKLARVERKSPTLGQKPPPGAIVLFDGTSLDNFEKGVMTEDKCLKVNTATKQAFQDFTLHVEFLLPYMPFSRGQGRANSGVYFQRRYELQVLDSFGLEGLDNECGGIYKVARPAVNMCYPPLVWQTYDVDYTAARYDAAGKKEKNAVATVRHNGVVIHENLEIPKGTGGNIPEGPTPGPVYLQGHGCDVVYRNIWIVEKK